MTRILTQEEKQLLLRDLCARLPYSVKINCFDVPRTLESISIDYDGFVTIDCGGEHFYHPLSNILHKDCLPYLRPMSSMTEEEKETYEMFFNEDGLLNTSVDTYVDWLLEGHFDFRGLIPKGLALEAPKDMYNAKTE